MGLQIQSGEGLMLSIFLELADCDDDQVFDELHKAADLVLDLYPAETHADAETITDVAEEAMQLGHVASNLGLSSIIRLQAQDDLSAYYFAQTPGVVEHKLTTIRASWKARARADLHER